MHRSHAVMIIFPFVIFFAACGGRIAQGTDDSDIPTNGFDAGNSAAFDAGTTAPTSNPPPTSAACGSETCGSEEECCVGGTPGGGDGPASSLESCVLAGSCDTSLLNDCAGGCDGANTSGNICCMTANPTTNYATAGCADSCGGNGAWAVQFCASDADCPVGSECFTAGVGPNGEGETVQICSGVR